MSWHPTATKLAKPTARSRTCVPSNLHVHVGQRIYVLRRVAKGHIPGADRYQGLQYEDNAQRPGATVRGATPQWTR